MTYEPPDELLTRANEAGNTVANLVEEIHRLREHVEELESDDVRRQNQELRAEIEREKDSRDYWKRVAEAWRNAEREVAEHWKGCAQAALGTSEKRFSLLTREREKSQKLERKVNQLQHQLDDVRGRQVAATPPPESVSKELIIRWKNALLVTNPILPRDLPLEASSRATMLVLNQILSNQGPIIV